MSLHFFELINHQLYLHGIEHQPIFLWDLAERLLQAENNVLTALKDEETFAPVFTGIEHLPALQKLWPAHRTAMIIEKSNLLIQFYQKNRLVDLSLNINIKIIKGDLGFVSAHANIVHQKSQLMQELSKIALQLYPIINRGRTHGSAPTYKTYFLDNCSLDEIYQSHLLHVYALVLHAQQFHQESNALYEDIKKNTKQKYYIHFLMNDTEAAQPERADLYPESFFKDYERINLVYGGANYAPIQQRLFPLGMCADTQNSSKYFEAFIYKAKNILNIINQYRPAYLIWRNRIIFDHLEDLLFVEIMFNQLEIPCIQYYGDLYTENTMEWAGAWTYFLSRDYLAVAHKYTLGPISILNQWYGISNNETKTYPYRYSIQHTNFLKSKNSYQDLHYDVVVIQTGPAPRNKLSLPNEFYYILKQFSDLESGKAISCYIERLRAYFLNNYAECFFYDAQININSLSHALTSICRVDRALDCSPVLARYRTKFFGNWQSFCPPQMYGGILQGSEVVHDTYNHSLVAVFFQHTTSSELIHHGALNAITAGCLPIVYRPSFEVGPAPAYPFFNGDSVPYFTHPQELASLLKSFKSNFQLRNKLISQMQNGWVQQLKDFKHNEEISEFLNKSVSNYDAQVDLAFCKDPGLEKLLLDIGVAWIFYAWGYDQHALEILFPILQSAVLKNNLFYLRGLQIAKNLGDHAKANLIAKIGSSLFPEEKVFENELAGITWEDVLSPLRCLTTYPGFENL